MGSTYCEVSIAGKCFNIDFVGNTLSQTDILANSWVNYLKIKIYSQFEYTLLQNKAQFPCNPCCAVRIVIQHTLPSSWAPKRVLSVRDYDGILPGSSINPFGRTVVWSCRQVRLANKIYIYIRHISLSFPAWLAFPDSELICGLRHDTYSSSSCVSWSARQFRSNRPGASIEPPPWHEQWRLWRAWLFLALWEAMTSYNWPRVAVVVILSSTCVYMFLPS
jgi:hypothetical protein